jgi:hypothetical protein
VTFCRSDEYNITNAAQSIPPNIEHHDYVSEYHSRDMRISPTGESKGDGLASQILTADNNEQDEN